MGHLKLKSIEQLEEKIRHSLDDPLRCAVLESAKLFKTSWIELGRSLYTVYKDKKYKEWGFNEFEIYTSKEIGIRKETSMKLLRSYFFLEKEEPDYLRSQQRKDAAAGNIPTYEAVDVLRQAKSKKILGDKEYQDLKSRIFEKGKDAREVKKDLTAMIRSREELEPEEAWEKKREAILKRMLGVLRSLKDEAKSSKLVSAQIIKETESLIYKLESEIPSYKKEQK
ncbi:MAG: hypothetical protein NTY14_08055 [Candidatus Omnitrophica bacterium]|nr:hypothetical protein [Candidatus Omnitrophota bacterium]